MRIALLGGVSLAMLAATPALAAPPVSNAEILARLNALEAKVDTLEAQNADLKGQLAAEKSATAKATADASAATKTASDAIAAVPTAVAAQVAAYTPARSAASGGADMVRPVAAGGPLVTWTIVPQFNSPDGNFSIKPRGVLEIDYANYGEQRGGYKYNDGTEARRGRFGFDGTLYKQFAWRLEGEWVDNKANLLDAYVAYTGVKNLTFTLGQLKVPAGLEADGSDSFTEFLERGMANTAFGAVGGERRVGATVAYADRLVTATAGVYGAGEAVDRNTTTPGEVLSYNGRVTIEPINVSGRVIHLGASAYRAQDFAANSVTLASAPNVRVDNGALESVAIAGTRNATTGAETGVKDAIFYGLEGAGILGPVEVQGEYSHMHLDRFAGAPSLDFDGYYAFGSVFLTRGDTHTFQGGLAGRVRPIRPFDPTKGNWGAVELAARYDRLNLTDRALSPLDHDAHSWTAAVNWYLNGYMKIMFNYIRFEGTNSPLVATPVSIYGTTAKGDAFATRLHLDF